MAIYRGKVTRGRTRSSGNLQVVRAAAREVLDLQPYGLQRYLPKNSNAVILQPDNTGKHLAILGYNYDYLELEKGEVALHSEHGQQVYLKGDGSLHIEAKLLSMKSEEEDLYSLLKDLLKAIKGLQTDKIESRVNGGSVTLAPSGTAPITGASGQNPGVGLSQSSSQKFDELAERLDKLLQTGEKAQSEEQATQARREQEEKDAKKGAEQRQRDKESQEALDSLLNGEDIGENVNKVWRPMNLHASEDIKELIKDYESLQLKAYDAEDGRITIGWGHLVDDEDKNGKSHTKKLSAGAFWYSEYVQKVWNPYKEYKKLLYSNAEIHADLKKSEPKFPIKINDELAEDLFNADIQYLEDGLNRPKNFEGGKPNPEFSEGRLLEQNEFDALIMFGMTNGRGGMLGTKFFQIIQKHKDFTELLVRNSIITNWESYNKSNGRSLLGLTYRRSDELRVFFNKNYSRNYKKFVYKHEERSDAQPD